MSQTDPTNMPGIDPRTIKCACGKPDCRIGLFFDGDEDGEIMFLQDKTNKSSAMHLDINNVTMLIEELKSIKNSLKRKQ